MAFNQQIPLATEDFRVYYNGEQVPGVIDVSPPQVKFSEVEVAGAGISGKVQVITNDVEELTLKIKFRGITGAALGLCGAGDVRPVELRAAAKLHDPSTGEEVLSSLIIQVKCKPKQGLGGTVAKAANMETEVEFAVYRYSSFFGGEAWDEYQPLAGIVRHRGVDVNSKVLALIG